MTKVFIDAHSYCTTDHREDDGHGHHRWEKYFDSRVNGVHLTRRGCYTEEFELLNDVEVGDVVHVLWMTYSDGDSFGNSNGNQEILWVFTDANVAAEALKIVQKNTKSPRWNEKDEKPYKLKFTIENGQEIEIGNPVYDYFTHVEDVHLNTFIVKN